MSCPIALLRSGEKVSANALAIVPCFNEEASVASVVSSIRQLEPPCDVLVVSDGSSDDSVRIAQAAGAKVLDLPCNLGIGGAMQAGYRYAVRCGYAIAIQVDGDGQHPAHEIPRLLEALQGGEADLVLGSRYLEQGRFRGRVSSIGRVLGGSLLSTWLRVLSGATISDPTSGFRAMNHKVLRLFAEEYPSDYPEPISLLMLFRRSLHVKEVGVRMRERAGGTSSIRHMHTAMYMLKVMWRMVLERVFR